MKAPTRAISYDKAIELMRRSGTRLVRMSGGTFVVPGGRVEAATADRILKHPLVRGGKDDLFPGLPETWRMIDTVRP